MHKRRRTDPRLVVPRLVDPMQLVYGRCCMPAPLGVIGRQLGYRLNCLTQYLLCITLPFALLISLMGTAHANETVAPASMTSASALVADYGELHYVSAGQIGAPLVVFVHGTPGSWQAFKRYLNDPRLTANTHMVALDRPGFGESTSMGIHPGFTTQAQAIAALFSLNQSSLKPIVVGHSLGGSISYRVGIDYADDIGGILAISSAIDPKLSKPRWYNHLARLYPVRWVIPKDLSASNKEMMPLASQLQAMQPLLGTIRVPVTIVQGAKDRLVHHKNLDFAQAHLVNAHLRTVPMDDAGHFIVWEHHQQMVNEILTLIDQQRVN